MIRVKKFNTGASIFYQAFGPGYGVTNCDSLIELAHYIARKDTPYLNNSENSLSPMDMDNLRAEIRRFRTPGKLRLVVDNTKH